MGEVREETMMLPGCGICGELLVWRDKVLMRAGQSSMYHAASRERDSPFLDAVNLNVHPPDARRAQDQP